MAVDYVSLSHRTTGLRALVAADQKPLYIWEAMALSRPEAVPAWCPPYLHATARKLTDLSWATGRGGVDPVRAKDGVPRMLKLVRQGQKNAFARMKDDAEAKKAGLNADRGYPADEELMARRSIEKDRRLG